MRELSRRGHHRLTTQCSQNRRWSREKRGEANPSKTGYRKRVFEREDATNNAFFAGLALQAHVQSPSDDSNEYWLPNTL